MPKTRRKKINTRPRTVYGSPNITAAVVTSGDHGKQGKNPKAKDIFTGRVYTGINTSKKYPYGSTRQGFKSKAAKILDGEAL